MEGLQSKVHLIRVGHARALVGPGVDVHHNRQYQWVGPLPTTTRSSRHGIGSAAQGQGGLDYMKAIAQQRASACTTSSLLDKDCAVLAHIQLYCKDVTINVAADIRYLQTYGREIPPRYTVAKFNMLGVFYSDERLFMYLLT